jgi:hypothetical protein
VNFIGFSSPRNDLKEIAHRQMHFPRAAPAYRALAAGLILAVGKTFGKGILAAA